jgi:D-alanyl-D-alanine carboxypeptidase
MRRRCREAVATAAHAGPNRPAKSMPGSLLIVRARRGLWWCVACAAAAAMAGCGANQTSRAQPHPSHAGIGLALSRRLQRTFDAYRTAYRLPGAAAAVIIPGEGSWSGGSGVADRETGTPVTAQTTFAIASITKAFVGALSLKLAQEGRISLQQPLSRTLPDWPYAKEITLRELLAQRSGVSEFSDTLAFVRALDSDPRALWSPRRVLSHAGAPSFRPDEGWQYNNANYLLAGLVLENATGESVASALSREILEPLGLRDVVLQPQQRPTTDAAHGYELLGDLRSYDLSDGTGFVPYRSQASAAWTAGGIVASAPSVAKFGDAIIRGTLLDPAERREMTNFEPTDSAGGYSGYALGLGQLGPDLWAAVGSTPGFGSTLAYFPSQHVTVAVLANQSDSTEATLQIAAILDRTATQRSG